MPEHADKENTTATSVPSDDGELTSPDFGFLADLISFHFRLLSIELNRSYDRSFVDTPLSGGTGKLSTLIVVANNPGVSQTNVAKALGKDRSAMVKLVDNLESKGLITRRTAPLERRAYALYPTDKGQALLDEASDIARQYDQDFFAVLTDSERDELVHILKKLRRHHEPGTAGL
ncbi:DNA-binding transcriptional regulator, MarR family [Vreelandella subterranea]|uniref:DNA-binding transcriptional regulator, MarR family n=1 Tax=Vreelandella subterranea TaxID=416874 RepID=A0A1H9W8K4_9GAMM|nr:MarR family winged helix-turn-helix transcriptional regulator [Halomonas subterranea]SES30185.1 DNA-binding transcriptional regulator, MarR family [Halomonas subterranea]